jgi:hypothetical protein
MASSGAGTVNKRGDEIMDDGLRSIPGVGVRIAGYLTELGYSDIASLKGQDPQEMFMRSCAAQGYEMDKCLLYVYRCAVYYAEHIDSEEFDPEKFKWWNWKDR